MDIKSFLRIGGSRVTKDFGLEIEVEGKKIPTEGFSHWHCERDGSLRGESIEYILTRPSTMEELKEALEELDRAFIRRGTKINNSFRAGIHTHINCQDLTPKQVISFACLYYIFEEVLIDWCCPTRKGNHFCLAVNDAEYILDHVLGVVEDGELRRLDTDDIRYASLNFRSLFRYGSLEFRALESTVDWERILTWCRILKRLKDYSLTYNNPSDIPADVSGTGWREWAEMVLGDLSQEFLKGDWEKKIIRGVRNSQQIAYGRDWESINLNIFKLEDNCFS